MKRLSGARPGLSAMGVFLFVLSGCYSEHAYHPRDAELEERLLKSEQIFDRLVQLADEDQGVARIASDFYKLDSNNFEPISVPTPRFSLYRWEQYRRLFKELELKGGLMRLSEYPGVLFLIPFYDELTEVDGEGYAYSSRPLAPLQDSFNDPRKIKSGYAFKYVKGNWYLYAIGKP
jgi:hypothetical protein